MFRTNNIILTSLPLIPVVFSAAFFTGCTWVKKDPAARSVRTVPADRVADCQSLGNVTTSTLSNISVVNRNSEKVEREVETLAQNQAAESGADTIVAIGKLTDGRRTFAMYKCLR